MDTHGQTRSLPIQVLANQQLEIAEKYKKLEPEQITTNPDAEALTAFNGYYALQGTQGGFFAIDTNLVIRAGVALPIYDVSLLISLDGKTSQSVAFSGTFDGTHLKQDSAALAAPRIDLAFSRNGSQPGPTATCTGTIGINGQATVQVLGATYNNPIPIPLFAATYSVTEALHVSTSKDVPVSFKVMQIKATSGGGYQLYYDYGTNTGELQLVESYVYNLNMYFFTFPQSGDSTESVNLIMGTAAAGGFACNNMVTGPSGITSRTLQSIPFPQQQPTGTPNSNGGALSAYSGYYSLPSISPGAFISIQGQYTCKAGAIDQYTVKIGVSLDGINSKGYEFDASTMTFENNTLVMTEQEINLTFTREYNAELRSLVSLSGSVGAHSNVIGYTLFNPVPLTAFGGAPMSNAQQDTLTIVSDTEVTYNGKTLDNFIYVPIMYILANPAAAPTIELSLGTAGVKGNASIVLQGKSITIVTEIR